MTCIDCCYSLLKDGNIICTYEEGNCIVTDRMKRLEQYADLADEKVDEKVDEVKSKLTEAKEIIRELLLSDTRKGSDWTGYLVDLKERAEAFLKEAENENSNQNS